MVEAYPEHRPGAICWLKLQNFGAYRNVTYQIKPHVNFIIGANESGKSTICVAIRFVFGSKDYDGNQPDLVNKE